VAIVPITRDAQVSCISLLDPAIDWERSTKASKEDVAKYVEAGKRPPELAYWVEQASRPASWRELIVCKDGQSPTEFILGVVPPAELSRIEDECGVGKTTERTRELYWRCFLHGLRDMRGGPTTEITVDGTKTSGVPKKKIDGVEYADPEWLARTFAGPLRKIALEIGNVIWTWNLLGPEVVKN
jgi:hypothetical protein